MDIPKCGQCHIKVAGYLDMFKCKYCGDFHCTNHKLPEDHNCYRLKEIKKAVAQKWNEVLEEKKAFHDLGMESQYIYDDDYTKESWFEKLKWKILSLWYWILGKR